MATFERVKLSGSTSGRGIKIVGTTSGTANVLHTTGVSSVVEDEIWLYAYNSDTSSRVLTVLFGGTSTPDDEIKLTIGSQTGLTLVVPGLILVGTGAAGVSVAAFASVTNVVTIQGYVNRIS